MSTHFDLNDLFAFRAVAELGNFRKAAESVHISQPAFSRRIDKLEQALGVRLLERSTRRVSLTVVGRDFDRQLRQILRRRPRGGQEPAQLFGLRQQPTQSLQGKGFSGFLPVHGVFPRVFHMFS